MIICKTCGKSKSIGKMLSSTKMCKKCKKTIIMRSMKNKDIEKYNRRVKAQELKIKKDVMSVLFLNYCAECKVFKSFNEFRKKQDKRNGLNTRCKCCEAKATKRYRESNREKIKEKKRASQSKRRAKTFNVNENFTATQRREVFEKFNNKCFNCGNIDNLVIDHHHPLSMGNPLAEENAVLLCNMCNCRKNNLHPIEFYSDDQLNRLNFIFNIKTTNKEEESATNTKA